MRSLLAHPWSTLVAILSVGVGFGVNLALAGFFWAWFVQEEQVPNGERVRWIAFVEREGGTLHAVDPPLAFLDRLSEGRAWSAVGAWDARVAPLEIGGHAYYRTWVKSATPGFHGVLGLTPAAGRFFDPADTVLGAPPVALLTHAEASDAFGTPGGALGQAIEVDGTTHTVVGVLPRGQGSGEYPVTVPLGAGQATRGGVRTAVLLAEGIDSERARAEIVALAARLDEEAGGAPTGVRVGGEKEVRVDGIVEETAPPLLVGLTVLLVAAANLATVLLGRGLARRRSLVVRRLLGASRWSLVRPLALESALMAWASAAMGLAVAWLALRSVLGSLPGVDVPGLSPTLVVYGSALVFVVIVVGGCWPAFVAGRVDASEAVGSGGQAVAGHGRAMARAMRVALALQVSVALPVVLLTGALALEAVRDARRGVGFDPRGLVHVQLPPRSFEGDVGAVLARAADEEPLQAVAATSVLPLPAGMPVEVDRGSPRLPTGPPPRALRLVRAVGDPLRLLGIRLVGGRLPTARETSEGAPVAVVGTTAARALFGTDDAVGRSVRIGGSADGTGWLTVVGVIDDVRDQPLFQTEPPPSVWTVSPLPGEPTTTVWARPRPGASEAGSRGLAAAVTATTGLRRPRVRDTEDWVRRQTAVPRTRAIVTAAGAGMTMLLCLLGLHGVTSLAVVQRWRELGVRSALGAGAGRLVGLVLGDALASVAVGSVIGLGLWIVSTRVLAGIPAAGIGVFAAAASFALLLGVAAGRPALRAGAAEPAAVLRES